MAGSRAALLGKLSSAWDVVGVSVVQLEELSLMRGEGRSKGGVFKNVCSAEIRSELTLENLRGPLRSYCTKFGKQNWSSKYETRGFQSCFKCKPQRSLNCGLTADASIVHINPVLSVMRRCVD